MSFQTASEAIESATRIFAEHRIRNPRQDAELLLQTVLRKERSFLFAHPEHPLNRKQQIQFNEWIELRSQHYPVQYIRGRQEFFSREFLVTPSVLIPRPETELLVEVSLRHLEESDEGTLVLDIGTGSACIAVTLACEVPHLSLVATDISPEALEIARRNARAHGCDQRIRFLLGDCAGAIGHGTLRFQLIVSNPPYVSTGEAENEGMDRSVLRYEPHRALFAGPTGLEVYRKIFSQAGDLLRSGGVLVLELGYGRIQSVCRLAEASGWVLSESHRDLAGIERCAVFRLA